MLKKIRFGLAVVVGCLIAFYFLDFAGLTTGWPNLARIQFIPALLAGSAGVVIVLLLLTLLFGRVYCSVICPMGIFQDLAARMSKRVNRKKKYSFSPEKKILRYGFLGISVLAFFGGAKRDGEE